MDLERVEVPCPYCGETVDVEIEPLRETQTFIQDCSVCCRPIQLRAVPEDEGVRVTAARSD